MFQSSSNVNHLLNGILGFNDLVHLFTCPQFTLNTGVVIACFVNISLIFVIESFIDFVSLAFPSVYNDGVGALWAFD